MLYAASLLLLCAVVPPCLASFIDEEGASFVQLTVERNWNRGKAKPKPYGPESLDGEMEDDISFMQTTVSNEHRINHRNSARSYDVHHMAAGVTADGDVDVVEEDVTLHRDRPPLSIDDAFSLLQTSVSLLQTGVETSHHDVAVLSPSDDSSGSQSRTLSAPVLAVSRSWTEAAAAALLTSPADAIAAAGRKAGLASSTTASAAQPAATGTGISWLDHMIVKLTATTWELREWLSFALCLVVLQCVVWKAAQTSGMKTKALHYSRSCGLPKPSTPPKRLSLTLPLRQLLSQTGSVKLSRSADGLAFVASLLEDSSGDRTLQLADAAEPSQAIMSIGPLPRSGLLEEGAAVHRYSTGYTLGALRSDGQGSWSLSKSGQVNLCISSSSPFTLSMSMSGREVAWVKPLSEAKEPDYVDLSFFEGSDPVLPVACALAVLVASSTISGDQTQQ